MQPMSLRGGQDSVIARKHDSSSRRRCGGQDSIIARKHDASTRRRRGRCFYQDEEVEIASKKDGFVGSYFPATIISELGDGSYRIKYTTLLEEDGIEFLEETVQANEIRPVPLEVEANRFSLNDYVDAYDGDGWWAGRVVGKVGYGYTVYFDTTGDRIDYPLERLRTHLEWAQSRIDGRWYWWHVYRSSASLSTPQSPAGTKDHTMRRDVRPSSIVA